jgi:hypothetical protein
MRVFALISLIMSLVVLPVSANDAKDRSITESRATTTATAEKETPKPEIAILQNEIQDLRSLVQEQRQELESQRAALKAIEEKLRATPPTPANSPVAASLPAPAVAPTAEASIAPRTLSAATATPAQRGEEEKPSPMFFKIGAAEFTPYGFMELMNTTRTTQLGGIATNFGSLAFSNTVAGRLSEDRISLQYSRLGLKTHAKFGEADVTGYVEADFLGYQPANSYITTNNGTLRMRVYAVDYKRGKLEILGGQTWSMMTPNRVGISGMPGDNIYSQDVDPNLQLGLTWLRQAGIRFIMRPNSNWSLGVAFENPEQTLPSSVVVPAAAGTGYASQFDLNSSNTSNATAVSSPNTPNLHPDIIPKIAYDANLNGHQVHFDLAGLFRTFKAVNVIATPSAITAANTVYTTIHGGGVAGTMILEVIKNFRLVSTAFYSYGGGRYISNTGGPDVIIRPNGTLSGVHAGTGIAGIEYQPNKNTMIYGYYGGAYFGRNYDLTGTTYTGYGFPVSGTPCSASLAANRYIYEPTFGINYTFWRNPSYGDIKLLTQYSYVSRAPWSLPSSVPRTAHTNMIYIDMRYDIP